MNLTNGVVILRGGQLEAPREYSVVLNANHRITNLSADRLSLSVAVKTGMFTGSFVHPDTGRSIRFQGVLLQQQNFGTGFFLDDGVSGEVYFGER